MRSGIWGVCTPRTHTHPFESVCTRFHPKSHLYMYNLIEISTQIKYNFQIFKLVVS